MVALNQRFECGEQRFEVCVGYLRRAATIAEPFAANRQDIGRAEAKARRLDDSRRMPEAETARRAAHGQSRFDEFGRSKRRVSSHRLAQCRDHMRPDRRALGIAKHRHAEEIGEKRCKIAAIETHAAIARKQRPDPPRSNASAARSARRYRRRQDAHRSPRPMHRWRRRVPRSVEERRPPTPAADGERLPTKQDARRCRPALQARAPARFSWHIASRFL